MQDLNNNEQVEQQQAGVPLTQSQLYQHITGWGFVNSLYEKSTDLYTATTDRFPSVGTTVNYANEKIGKPALSLADRVYQEGDERFGLDAKAVGLVEAVEHKSAETFAWGKSKADDIKGKSSEVVDYVVDKAHSVEDSIPQSIKDYANSGLESTIQTGAGAINWSQRKANEIRSKTEGISDYVVDKVYIVEEEVKQYAADVSTKVHDTLVVC